ncbi:hypothetical protein PIB30_028980 [Stylosanthes scabra]|uniref:Uncharacterized protein n=1 Tax=Stylosanthes scabra TaxID=79078 RepID=A0ABU6VBA7_9FABA|nr:hypothetical protein [Stylosanthes scabra]
MQNSEDHHVICAYPKVLDHHLKSNARGGLQASKRQRRRTNKITDLGTRCEEASGLNRGVEGGSGGMTGRWWNGLGEKAKLWKKKAGGVVFDHWVEEEESGLWLI